MLPFWVGSARFTLRRPPHRQQLSHLFKRHNHGTEKPPPPAAEKTTTETQARTVPNPNTVSQVFWDRFGPVSSLVKAYGRAQKTRPYTTQVVSSVVIYICGDLSAQRMRGEPYDPLRTVRAIVIGGAVSIPSYRWFLWLGESFNYPSKILSLATKVVVNQLVFTPIFNTYFFGAQALLSGDTVSEAWDRIKMTVPVSFVNAMKLWPAVTAFSFTFIQPQFRSIFAGVIAIGWQTYLSWLNQKAAEEEHHKAHLSESA